MACALSHLNAARSRESPTQIVQKKNQYLGGLEACGGLVGAILGAAVLKGFTSSSR